MKVSNKLNEMHFIVINSNIIGKQVKDRVDIATKVDNFSSM